MHADIAVEELLWSGALGTVFSGRVPGGGRLIVTLDESLHPVKGEVYRVAGKATNWIDQWGRSHPQLQAVKADRIRTSGALLGPWLRTLDGIGEERAARLLARFGDEVVDALSNTDRAGEIAEAMSPGRPHLGQRLAALIQAKFAGARAAESMAVKEAEFYAKLEQYGVDNMQAARALYRLIGSPDAWSKLLAHPYSAAAVLRWKNADYLGQRLLSFHTGLVDPACHPARLAGACDAAWQAIMSDGHTACSEGDFLAALYKLKVLPAEALACGIAARRVMVTDHLLRAPGAAWMERAFAAGLARLSTPPPVQDWNFILRHGAADIRLTPEQRSAVVELLRRSVSVLQGGAGTGKTTTMRALVDAWEGRGGNVVLAALAGKAALRLSRSTGRVALTLARLVHGLERRRRLLAENRPIPKTIPGFDAMTMLVVDESSMVDLVTWRRIIEFLPDGARLVMVGDVAQLPPVGLGSVFHDLVDDGRIVSVLTETHRQACGNPLIAAASAVRDGSVPETPAYAGVATGVYLLECPDEGIEAALDRVRQDFAKEGTASDQLLVLAGMNRTCRRVGAAMQVRLEQQGLPGVRLGPLAPFVSVGDPVVCTRNRYDESLMNGLMGWVVDIAGPLFRFDGEDAPRSVSGDAVCELMSAWAITCHRAQGSDAQRVVVALDGKEGLTREWVYTAMTRAAEQIVFVGSTYKLHRAVSRHSVRRTGFSADLSVTVLQGLRT
jgi:exodeoxyribonuclease V alpha subunit